MSSHRQNSSASQPRPVPSSPNASRGRSPPAESTPRATSTAKLNSPIPSLGQGGISPVRQIPTPSQLNSGNQTPLAGIGLSQSTTGPGRSALAAAFQGSLGGSPPKSGTPPIRSQSPGAAGAPLQGVGPPATYGSFENRSSHASPRRAPSVAGENPRVVMRHLVQPSDFDVAADTEDGPSAVSHRTSTSNFNNGRSTATGMGGEEFSSLQLQGGDITREVYKWAENAETQEQGGRRGKRSQSWHVTVPESEGEDMDATSIRKPGGFRRDYIRRNAPSPSGRWQQSSKGTQNWTTSGFQAPTMVTKSFYEFLSVYGHFAGGDLEEDDEDDYFYPHHPTAAQAGSEEGDEGSDWGESSALLTPAARARRRTLKERGATGNNSPGGAALLLLKSFIGTGVLFLPRAYLNGGMLFSNLILLGVAALSYYNFILLVNTRLRVHGSFGDMGGIIYGKWMRGFILFSITLSQIGFVAAYIVFTSQNLQAFVSAVSNCREFIDIKWMILMQLVVFLPFSLIRDIGRLGWTALVADAFIFIGLLYLAGYDIRTLAVSGVGDIIGFNPSSWTLFIGTAIFTFEGVGLIIPIQESMKDPSKFPPVLAGVMIAVTVLYVGMGALSYAAFGSSTRTVVLLNLPQDSKFVNSVQLLYSLAILLSTPLQLFPAVRIMETELFSRSGKYNWGIKWKKNLFRFFVVMCCTLIAWGGAADLDKFVALVGSFACIPLVYIYPPALHFKAVAQSKLAKGGDFLLGIFGFFAMAYTTILTIQSWAAGSKERPPGYCDA